MNFNLSFQSFNRNLKLHDIHEVINSSVSPWEDVKINFSIDRKLCSKEQFSESTVSVTQSNTQLKTNWPITYK
jgi:hypothetical protein